MEFKRLQTAYQDKSLQSELKTYMEQCIRNYAADMALMGEDTSGIKPAKGIIDRLFKQMFKDFSAKEEKDIKNPSF